MSESLSDPIRLWSSPREAAWGRRDVYFQIPMSRNLAIGIVLSLVLHFFFLFALKKPVELKMPEEAGPLDVQLAPPATPHPSERPHPIERPSPVQQERRPERQRVRPSESRAMPVLTAPKSNALQQAAPKMSFMDYVNAARRRRDADQNEYPEKPQPMGPMQDSGVKPQGTSGVFQLIRISDSSAEFSFRGWHSEYSNSHKEVFDVEAGTGQDVKLAVIRKIIEIIRRYYKGDFNWDSQRLGTVVVLSARPKDDKALESFLMKDFFGSS